MSDTRAAAAARRPPDEELTELSRHGDAAAFAAIVRRYQPELLAHARRLVPEGRADDVVQQAFLNAWSALRSGSEVAHLRGWLHAIVRNAASRARQPVEAALPDDAVAGEPLEELVQRRAKARAALSQLNELPIRQRDALLSTALHGVPRARVASRMGLSEGAVRQLVHRARSTLRDAVPALVPYPLLRALGHGAGDGAGAASSALAGTDSGGALVKLGAVLASGAIATGFAVDEVTRAPAHHRAMPAPPTVVSKHHPGRDRGVPTAGAPAVASAPTSVLRPADDDRVGGDDAEHGASRRESDDQRRHGSERDRGGRGGPGGPRSAGRGPASSRHRPESPGQGPASSGQGPDSSGDGGAMAPAGSPDGGGPSSDAGGSGGSGSGGSGPGGSGPGGSGSGGAGPGANESSRQGSSG